MPSGLPVFNVWLKAWCNRTTQIVIFGIPSLVQTFNPESCPGYFFKMPTCTHAPQADPQGWTLKLPNPPG